ncbi:MAG: hypothetical protein ABR499_06385 [Gemmatimonadaceae bacterium]
MATTIARADAASRRRPRREGLRAGAVGATAVWVWLVVSDMHARTPFSTPAFLGRGLLSVDARGGHVSPLAGVVAFTIAHYALWMAVGTLIIAAVRRAVRTPSILLGLILLLILMQFLFVGITAILAQGQLGAAAWRDLMIGDVFGWGSVAWYVVRAHKELRGELARAGEGG